MVAALVACVVVPEILSGCSGGGGGIPQHFTPAPITPAPSATATPVPGNTATPTAAPSSTAHGSPSASPSASASASPTPVPTSGTTATPAPTATATATPTHAPTQAPTATPVPTASPTPVATPAFNNWTTYGFDNARDGYNPNSGAITPASLAKLHLAWQITLPNNDFNTQTQPVLATNVGGHAGILVVGGTLGSVYGYDALTGAQVWTTPLGSASYTCSNGTTVPIAIGGTAVYDPSTGSIFVANNSNAAPNAATQLWVNQLNVATGALIARVNVAPNPLSGELNFTHTSLTLAGGTIYAGTGSTCDISSWRGRVVAVNEGSMSLANTFYTVWNQTQAPLGQSMPFSGGGVWGWGGVSIDPNGNVWAAVGNVDTNAGTTGPQSPFVQDTTEFDAFGEHLVQLTPDLSNEIESNYPGFTFGGASVDLDLNGSAVLGQPPMSVCPMGHVAAAVQGKSGYLYLYDTTNLASPVNAYKFAASQFRGRNQGNPTFSPVTGMYYAAVASSVAGGITPAPGMVAIAPCSFSSSIAWTTAFGPDSQVAGVPRGAPTVTAGGVVLSSSPCQLDMSGGCTGTSGTYGGALWALDASSGAILNGGNPLITTPSAIRMGAVVDGDWLYLFDNNGDLYGLTIDPSYPAIQDRFRRQHRIQRVVPLG